MSDASFDYVESLSTQELEFELYRINIIVRRGTFKEATYRRILINKLKNILLTINMTKDQARSLSRASGKKSGDVYEKNTMSI